MESQRTNQDSLGCLPVAVKRDIVAIIGLISSGKSTLLQKCQEMNNVLLIPECIDRYRTFKTHDPLALIYQDVSANIVAAQHHFIKSINQHLAENVTAFSDKLIVSDRTLFSPDVFIQAHFTRNTISEFTRDYLLSETQQFASRTLKDHSLRYAGVFFLDIAPEICMKRIAQRGRDCEQSITLDYLHSLQEQYTKHIQWWQNYLGDGSRVYVATEANIDTIYAQFSQFVKTIC